MRASLRAGAAAVAMLAAACGTTVPGADQLVASRGDGMNAGQRRTATPLAGTEVTDDAYADDSVATVVAGTRMASRPSAGAGATKVTAPDRTPIKVGAFYLNGGNELLGAGFAATPVNFGDGQLEAKAVVADINARGGVGGRPIELHLHKFEATDASNPEAFEAACIALADDHKVFVIMSIFNIRSPLANCAAKRKTLLIGAALGAGDDHIYREFGDWTYTPAAMSLDTEQKLVLQNAVATKVVTKSTRVGVIIQNDDEIFGRVFKNTIEPTLKSLGVPYESFTIANANDATGISNAILKFATNDVRVVQFSAGNGGIPAVVFMQAAEQQQYRPKYIMGDSTDTWFVGNAAPRNQASRITGVGSYPVANVNADQVPPTPGEKRCFDVITAAGQRITDRHSSLTATFYCEMLYGFAAAGARVQGKMTHEAWRSAYRSFGATYPSMITFLADVTRTPNAPAAGYRTLGWNTACDCVAYTSPLRRL